MIENAISELIDWIDGNIGSLSANQEYALKDRLRQFANIVLMDQLLYMNAISEVPKGSLVIWSDPDNIPDGWELIPQDGLEDNKALFVFIKKSDQQTFAYHYHQAGCIAPEPSVSPEPGRLADEDIHTHR
jgi:hypothetical protein